MNDIIESLQNRRSIRKYTGENISAKDCKVLLQTAVQAPTARGLCPCRFILVRDREMLNALSYAHPYATMLQQAGAAVVVCGDLKVQAELGYILMDGAAATTQLLSAAHAMGFGSCWLGLYPREERVKAIRDLMGIPEHIYPISLVALGYAAEEKGKPDRYKDEEVHLDRW